MIQNENTIKMSSKTIPFALFIASSIVLCQTFEAGSKWDGTRTLVKAINSHNIANSKERDGNSDWLEVEKDSLSAFDDDIIAETETDESDISRHQLDSSQLEKFRKMKIELEKDVKQYKNPIQPKLNDKLPKESLGKIKMERRETLVTLPIAEDTNGENKCGEKCHTQYGNFLQSNNKHDPNYKDLLDILTKQLYVVENFVEYLKEEKNIGRQGKTEFDELLDSIQNKSTTVKVTTTEASTVKEVSMVTLIDESDIRDALKNDPLVKRIIKMAKKKRGKYIHNLDSDYA